MGAQALRSNTTGFNNTAIGAAALISNTTAEYNTAIGSYALEANINSRYNTAVGGLALNSSTVGDNTAVGYQALHNTTTGNANTGVGVLALAMNTTGTFNTAIGYNANANNYSNSTAVGYNAQINASNQVRLGNGSISTMYCQGAYAATTANAANMYVASTGQIMRSTSSKRYKTDIEDLKINTENIYKLRPVSYTSIIDGERYFGLIAEEVAEVLPELAEYAAEKQVIVGSESDKMIPDAVKYPMLSVLLLKEVQIQKKTITELQLKIDKYEQMIGAIESINAKVEKLTNENESLKSEVERLKPTANK